MLARRVLAALRPRGLHFGCLTRRFDIDARPGFQQVGDLCGSLAFRQRHLLVIYAELMERCIDVQTTFVRGSSHEHVHDTFTYGVCVDRKMCLAVLEKHGVRCRHEKRVNGIALIDGPAQGLREAVVQA